MLKQLIIKDYALIESLDLEFSSGLNILTGETGAGKTIIIEALGLILGNRTSTEIVRKGTKSATVSAVFDVSGNTELREFLDEHNLGNNGDSEFIIRREIEISGRSKSYCNDQPVTLSLLNEIGDFLVDIHGQHEHQVFLKPINQLGLLDCYGNLDSLREKIRDTYKRWQNLSSELEKLQLSQSEREQKLDIYKYQLKEINSTDLKPDEDNEIATLLPQLKNAQKLISFSQQAYGYLYDEENSAIYNLTKVQKLISDITTLSQNNFPWATELENIVSQLKDIAVELNHYRSE